MRDPKRRRTGSHSRKPRETPAAAPSVASKASRWALAIVAIAGLVTYANSVANPFVLDDIPSIVDNEDIRSLSDVSSLLFPLPELPTSGRPVANVSLALNYALGGLNVTG